MGDGDDKKRVDAFQQSMCQIVNLKCSIILSKTALVECVIYGEEEDERGGVAQY